MNTQGSMEWFAAREANLTSSKFSCVVARPTSKKYQEYLADKVNEILGVPNFDDDQNKPWHSHGKEWEDEARISYEFQTGNIVDNAWYIKHPDFDFIGGSPDGLVNDDGGIEIKCRKSLTAHEKSIDAGMESTHKPQVQGYLWITGREWFDFISYFKDEDLFKTDLHIHRVYADLEYHKKLETACLMFWRNIQERLKK
jgi:hypothetical protein